MRVRAPARPMFKHATPLACYGPGALPPVDIPRDRSVLRRRTARSPSPSLVPTTSSPLAQCSSALPPASPNTSPAVMYPVMDKSGKPWGGGANRVPNSGRTVQLTVEEPAGPVFKEAVEQTTRTINFVRTDITDVSVQAVFLKAQKVQEGFLGPAHAAKWAHEYFDALGTVDFPWKLIEKTTNECKEAGSLEAMVANRRAARAAKRLSVERIDLVFSEPARRLALAVARSMGVDPPAVPPPPEPPPEPPPGEIDRDKLPFWPSSEEFDLDISRMKQVATEGIPIVVDPTFIPSAERRSIPPVKAAACAPTNAHLHINNVKDDGVIIDAELAATLKGLHYQEHGWTPKWGKPEGRMTADCSHVSDRTDPDRCPLNTPFVHEDAEERWGPIHSPTLSDVCVATSKAAAKFGRENLVIGKMDIKSFYQQAFFAIGSIRLMAFAVHSVDPRVNGATYISTSGNFGHTATPNVMEVFTRCIRIAAAFLIVGYFLMYIDDAFFATSREAYQRDYAAISWILNTLFGPGAHAVSKDECSDTHPSGDQRLVMIGWELVLSTFRVDMSPKNRDRALYFFIAADPEGLLSTRERERLVSLAGRYSEVYPHLKVIYNMICQLLGGMDYFDPLLPRAITSGKAKLAILIWRAYLVMSHIDHHAGLPTGRLIELFCHPPPGLTVEFDGSLKGTGWRLWDGVWGPLCHAAGYAGVDDHFFPAKITKKEKTAFQNTMELMALTLALLHAALLGFHHCGVALRGDSNTVLQWASKTSFRSVAALPAITLFIAVCERFHLHVDTDFVQLLSADNPVCDALSRNRPADAMAAGHCGPGGPVNFGCTARSPGELMSVGFHLCSVRTPLTTEQQFFDQWARVNALLDRVAAAAAMD